MWDYLSEFWNAITEVGETTVEWFQNIGNAVAGAIGGMFEWLIRYVNDFFILLGWIFSILKELIVAFVLPISYIFNFLRAFTISAFSGIQDPELTYEFSGEVLSVFQAIPYWSTIGSVIGIAFLVIGGVGILKLITKIT